MISKKKSIIGVVAGFVSGALAAWGIAASGSSSTDNNYLGAGGMASCTTDSSGVCSYSFNGTTFGASPDSVILTARTSVGFLVNSVAGSVTSTGGKALIIKNNAPLANTYVTFYWHVDGIQPTTSPSSSASATSTPTITPSQTPTPTPTATQSSLPPTGWPDASNTGVPSGTTLTNSGSINVTTDGQVIDAKNITGTITVNASNVVIKNSKINAGTAYWGIEIDSGSATIQDSEITGSAAGAVWGKHYTLLRDNIHDFHGDGMKLNEGVTVKDSWIHNATTQNGQHADGMQLEVGASNVLIQHNSINPLESGSNAAVFIKNDLGPDNTVGPVTVDHNLLGGGGFTLYAYKGSSGLIQGGVTIENNHFLRDFEYGPMAINIPVTCSGNVYDDNNAAISC